MKRAAWSRVAKLITAIAFAVAAGTWTVGQLREREVARRDQQEVARMTKEMETVCLGRFLIDMPSEAQLGLRGVRVDGLEIESFEELTADFLTRLALREKRLKGEPKQLVGTEYLESVTEVNTDNDVVGKIFVHGRTLKEGTRMSGSERKRYRYEGVVVEAMVHGGGMSFEIGAKDYNPDLIENLPKLVAKLVPNRSNRAPTEPGFCFDGGWFRDPLTADQGERIMMNAHLPSHPDIRFLTILAAGNKPATQSLLERSAATDAGLTPDEKKRISRLRADRRTIGGIVGDELVRRFVEQNDAISYSFWWEVDGTENDVFVPHVLFQMDTGESDHGPVPSSLSQEAVMPLWDKISSSIRLHHPRPPGA
jgi:hypothetical protein